MLWASFKNDTADTVVQKKYKDCVKELLVDKFYKIEDNEYQRQIFCL